MDFIFKLAITHSFEPTSELLDSPCLRIADWIGFGREHIAAKHG